MSIRNIFNRFLILANAFRNTSIPHNHSAADTVRGSRKCPEKSARTNGCLAPSGLSHGTTIGRHRVYLAADGKLRLARIGKPFKVRPAVA